MHFSTEHPGPICNAGYHLSQNVRKFSRNAKNEKCIKTVSSGFAMFFVLLFPHFAFRHFHTPVGKLTKHQRNSIACNFPKSAKYELGRKWDVYRKFFAFHHVFPKIVWKILRNECVASLRNCVFLQCFVACEHFWDNQWVFYSMH